MGSTGPAGKTKPASSVTASTVRLFAQGLRWRCLAGYQTALFGHGSPNWPNLTPSNFCEPVKSNPLRSIYRLSCGRLEIYAKLYRPGGVGGLGKWAVRGGPGRREFESLRTAYARGAPVALPLAYGSGLIGGRVVSILITLSLGKTYSLEDLLWQREPPGEKELATVLSATANAVGKMHCSGIIHNDLHPGNISIADTRNEAYLMDMQNVTIAQRQGHPSADPLRNGRINNVAVLFAGIRHRANCALQEHFLRSYLESIQPGTRRSEQWLCDYFNRVQISADRHDNKVARRRDRRCLRNSRYCRKLKLSDGWAGRVFLECKHPPKNSDLGRQRFETADWRATLTEPRKLTTSGKIIKKGRRNTVISDHIILQAQQLDVIVKQYRFAEGARGLLETIRRSRGLRQWHRSNMLLNRHMPTAFPLAVLERRSGPLLRESIFVSQFIPNSINLCQMVRCGDFTSLEPTDRRDLAEQLGEILGRLARFGLRHRDCKATNIVVGREPAKASRQEGQYRAYLVDLDGVSKRILPPLTDIARHEAIIRLTASMIGFDEPNLRDLTRVFTAYLRNCGTSARKIVHNRPARRNLWQKIALAAQKRAEKSRKRARPNQPKLPLD